MNIFEIMRVIFLFSLFNLIKSKAIEPIEFNSTMPVIFDNITEMTTMTPNTTIMMTTIMLTKEFNLTNLTTATATTIQSETTSIATPHEVHSVFHRNNDSVFVLFRANQSDAFISINNTFVNDQLTDIEFTEHSILSHLKNYFTNIFIRYNGTFTRHIASQLGDRLLDIADILSTIRTVSNRSMIVETH